MLGQQVHCKYLHIMIEEKTNGEMGFLHKLLSWKIKKESTLEDD